jgi:hypothetical protein
VPKSRLRKKKVYTAPAELRPQRTAAAKKPSAMWLPILAVSLIVFGIGWLVAFYLTSGFFDIAKDSLFKLGYWNLAIGFGAMVSALMLLSKWR